jgi:hypothetical protein
MVAESKILRLGDGLVDVTPQYVTGFSYVLGIDAGDLAALTGVGPPTNGTRPHPHRAELAQIAWDARRLDDEQLAQTIHVAAPLWRTFPTRYCHACGAYEKASTHSMPR